MLRFVWTKSLYDARRGLIGWMLGVAAMVGLTVALWPSYSETIVRQGVFQELVEDNPAMAALTGQVDLASAEGYVASQLFGFMMPLLLIIQAVGMGATAIAGEEERGDLETLVSLPLSRRRVVLERWLAAIVCSVLVGVVFAAVLLGGAAAVDLGVATEHLVRPVAATVLLALGLGAVALAVGAATGRRVTAIASAAAVGVVGWFLNAFGPMVEVIEPLRGASPFYWAFAGDAVREGLPPAGAAALVASVLALTWVAVFTFERRDLAR